MAININDQQYIASVRARIDAELFEICCKATRPLETTMVSVNATQETPATGYEPRNSNYHDHLCDCPGCNYEPDFEDMYPYDSCNESMYPETPVDPEAIELAPLAESAWLTCDTTEYTALRTAIYASVYPTLPRA